jgi:hypothetical protein
MNKDDYTVLRRAADADKVDPHDMDQLLEDISGVLHSCRVDESNISDEERMKNEELMTCITWVHNTLQSSSDVNAGAMALLFRKRIATPTNLEALLRMMDADVRTGIVRCVANNLITVLASIGSIYGLKMNDGSYFESCLASRCSKSLQDEADQSRQIPHMTGCRCFNDICRTLKAALQTLKEDPLKVLERIDPFDWKKILETYPPGDFADEVYRYQLFSVLWDKSLMVLVYDPSNSKAKSFLRKLGTCHELFRIGLRRIVGLRSLPSSPGNMSTTLEYLMCLSAFYEVFHLCLVPPPSDPEIEVLVSLANHSLKEARPTVLAAIQFRNHEQVTIEQYDRMIKHTQADSWTRVKLLTDDDRWRHLETDWLSKLQAGDLKKARKSYRQSAKTYMKSNAETQHGNDEVCTNCFRLESDLEEGKKLMFCGWCKQVNYCSRECQKVHWNKTHKKECIGGKGQSKNK